jgi:peptidylprolyl isomerase
LTVVGALGACLALALAGCSGSSDDEATTTPSPLGDKATATVEAAELPGVTGTFASTPEITFPLKPGFESPTPTPTETETEAATDETTDGTEATDEAASDTADPSASETEEVSAYIDPPSTLQVTTALPSEGDGTVVKENYMVAADMIAYKWGFLEPVYSTYYSSPEVLPIRSDASYPILGQILIGQTIGSRIVAVVPPTASAINTAIGAEAGDTIVLVFDIYEQYPSDIQAQADAVPTGTKTTAQVEGALGGPATITVPGGSEPPEKITTTVIATGSGAPIADGDLILYHYAAIDWNGDDGGSSWVDGWGPATATVSSNPYYDGTVNVYTGLIGVTVGSRVVVEAPAKAGAYAGEAVVMDIIAVVKRPVMEVPEESASAEATEDATEDADAAEEETATEEPEATEDADGTETPADSEEPSDADTADQEEPAASPDQ